MSTTSEALSPQIVDVCAKLVTTRNGRKEVLLLDLNRPVVIGRNPGHCSYVVNDAIISAIHCKLYAVRSPSGGIIVSCQDMSKNGLFLNGFHFRNTAVILMDGDVLELPNLLAFKCFHLVKEPIEKMSIFDPTPPSCARTPIQKHIGRYVVMSQCLGTGSFATVHLAFDPINHKQVACKSIRTRRDNEVRQVTKEIRILMTLRHPNINEIYDTEEGNNFMFGKFMCISCYHHLTHTLSHIFLQLCTGGDLFSYVSTVNSKGSRICEAEAKYIMFQLFQGLAYLHNKHVSHRDLKPENILLHAPGPFPRILIADFGLARPNAYQETLNVCGTVSYLPPEGILALDNNHLGYVGMPADCWSAGVIMYIIMSGSHPFDNEDTYESFSWLESPNSSYRCAAGKESQASFSKSRQARLKARIVHENVSFRRPPWCSLPEATSLAQGLLVHDLQRRATVFEALKYSWITSEIGDLETLYRRRILLGR